MDVKVHFFTIVRNGMPFIRHHHDVFLQLKCDWHWHVVEGAADLTHDTAWSCANGAQIPNDFHEYSLSRDGTTEYLDELFARNPSRVTLYRKASGQLWDGKLEMVRAPLNNLPDECILWQVDCDEFWTKEQIDSMVREFELKPDKTAAWYWCNFYVSPNAIISTRNCYSQNSKQEWLRTWRYRLGDQWAAHEPPTLERKMANGALANVGKINPILHSETEAVGAIFNHFAYVNEEQINFKEQYYGYQGALWGWHLMQRDLKIVPELSLANYFSWVKDLTRVKLIDSEGRRSFKVIVDGNFFQYSIHSGIARVWSEVLKRWGNSAFGSQVLLLNRNGTAPEFPGIQSINLPLWKTEQSAEEALRLDELCKEVGASWFISSYYSCSVETPSMMLLYDMIPEVMADDIEGNAWPEKIEKDFCIKGINKYVNNDIISKNIYDSHGDKNITVIDIDEINKVIKFKNTKSQKLHYKQFMNDVKELIEYTNNLIESNNIDDIDFDALSLNNGSDDINEIISTKSLITDYINENKLSMKGLTRYLKVNRSYLENIGAEEALLNFHTNITRGFVDGLQKQRNTLRNLEENRIIGLYNY